MSKESESLQAPDSGTDTPEPPAQLAMLQRAAIVPSRTNPRTHFDADYIKELAASIRVHKLLQPILVRPLPAARLQDTFADRQPGAPLPTHEIVCGECRWRACDAAGEDQIPVLIRILTDIQVLQVQLVENLRRKDLHPLEEAEGFERLMKDHGMTVEEIAAKIDKSASQIYVTLKLLELTPECRKELYAGKLTRSTALLVARTPEYLQPKVAKDIMTLGVDGEPMTYRAAVRHIHQHYMLQLSTAVFDIKDASLVAKAGDCQACPKRTGANSDLFEDVKHADTCTDPKCFDAKKVAHFAQVTKAAEAKGQKVIQGKEAKELYAYEGATPTGFMLLDTKEYIEGKFTTARAAIGKANLPTPVLIVNPHTKELQEALPVDVASKLLKQTAGKKATKELSEQDLDRQYQEAWKVNAVKAIFAEIMAGKMQTISVDFARELALYMAQDIYAEEAELVTDLLGIGKVAQGHGIEGFIKDCPANMVAPALLLCALVKDLDAYTDQTPFLTLLAKDTAIDLTVVQDDVKADMRDAAEARKAAAEEATDKAKKPAPKGKAKKTTAVDAKAGIAQAMQNEPATVNNFEVGQRVRFKLDLKGPTGKLRKVSGRDGTIESKIGDRAWSVRFGEKAHETARADYTEIEQVEDASSNGVTPTTDPAAAWPFVNTPKKPSKAAAA